MSYNISEAMYNLRAIENLENITEDQLDDIFSGIESSYMSICIEEDKNLDNNDDLKKDTIKRIKEIFQKIENIYEYLMNKDTFVNDSCVTKELEKIREIGKVFTI